MRGNFALQPNDNLVAKESSSSFNSVFPGESEGREKDYVEPDDLNIELQYASNKSIDS